MGGNLRNSTYQRYFLNIVSLYKQRRDVKAYLELLLSIGAISILIVFAIKPTIVTITDLLTRINSEKETSEKLDIKIKDLGIAQDLYNQQESNINLLNSAVPDNADVASYIRQVEGLVQKNSLTTTSITVNQVPLIGNNPITNPSLGVTSSITVSGTYENLQSFIKDLENLRRPAILTKVSLLTSTEGLTLTVTPNAAYTQ